MSQVNYETGKRSPDAEYLLSASGIGVDVGYVITGKRSGTPDFYRLATVLVLEGIQKRTGFAEDVLSFVIESIAEAAASVWLEDPGVQAYPDNGWNMESFVRFPWVDEMIAALFENARLLRDVFSAIDSVLVCNSTPRLLSGGKRVSLVIMLFKAFRTTDHVDYDVVEDAIELATK